MGAGNGKVTGPIWTPQKKKSKRLDFFLFVAWFSNHNIFHYSVATIKSQLWLMRSFIAHELQCLIEILTGRKLVSSGLVQIPEGIHNVESLARFYLVSSAEFRHRNEWN